ncbi:flippase activity-associated protein Agl23 [Halosimplex salinum]|uniref:flippase activity-associated protein Agl23 n=1 Tax=Halosimplex salinum TaxID=1710538 RepID=UPI000F493E7F|nr:flippase activity-associated protein Agl23 [Halosimplex salinum]
MATADDRSRPMDTARDRLERYGLDRVHTAVVATVLVGFVARFYELGARTAHWDEGRVAYWVVDYAETGTVRYRPGIHGPFFQHVNEVVFGALGATDFSMRVIVAVVTGFFPLVALCFRDRLRDVEVVALAGLLAFTPVVLYYSRFMRGDPLVAAFMVTAFALFVRTVDTGRRRYFYAGVAFTALGFTVKENALLYLLTWVGAAGLLLDHRLFRAADSDSDPAAVAVGYVRRVLATARRHVDALLLGVAEFLAVIVFFYAPRGRTGEGPGLGAALADPTLLPATVRVATVGSARKLWGHWVAGSGQDHPYLPYLADFLVTLRHGALAVCLLAVVGFVADRYRDGGPSDLVSFAAYWGFVSVLGYPLVTDIKAPWATLHAVVPLAIPAAVGVGLFVRWGRDAVADDDAVSAAVAMLVLLAVAGQVVVAGVGGVYQSPPPDENELVQYAQPAGDVQSVMRTLDEAAAGHEGTDVVLYGDYFVTDPNATGPLRPACSPWTNVLPLPWYFERADADVACAGSPDQFVRTVEQSRPPVVVARPIDESRFSTVLSGYESRTHLMRGWDTEVDFYVREEYTNGSAG